MTRRELYRVVYRLCLVSALWLWQSGVPAHAASPSVEGRYANQSALWAGSYRLDRYGNVVIASLTAERSPVQRFARTQPQALFTVPEGFRPAQAGIWEVTARQVDAQGEIIEGEPRIRFDVRVTPDGAVRYVDNAKTDSAGYVAYTAILTWMSVEVLETIAGEYPARAASGRYRLVHRGAAVTLMLSSTRSPMLRLAHQRPPILFTVPESFRPAQTETWEVTGRPVDVQGQALPGNPPIPFDMRVTPDGAVRYADHAKADNASYLAYATAVTWRVPADVCRRTAAVRQDLLLALQAAGRPRVSCAAVTWPDLAAIRSLDMDGVTTLEAGALAGLISLQELDLSDDNPLRKLESGALAGLIRLRKLDLSTTRGWRHTGPQTISAVPYGTVLPPQPVPGWDMADMTSGRARLAGLPMLPQDAFAGLISLQELSLSRNALTTLPSELFADLGNLHELRLNDNALTALPYGLFAGLTRLLELDLAGGNNLMILPSDLFADLDNLQGLYLGSVALTALPSDFFAGLTHLKRLRLNGHNLTTLPVDLFADLDNLETLALYGNELASLPSGLFADLDHVYSLRLRLNPIAITSLSSGLLAPLTGLLRLDLAGSALTTLPSDIFADLTNLRVLDLRDNALTTLPSDIFADLDCLGELILVNNALAAPLPADIFAGLSNLKVLFLDGNPGSCPYLTGNSDLCVRPQFAEILPSC